MHDGHSSGMRGAGWVATGECRWSVRQAAGAVRSQNGPPRAWPARGKRNRSAVAGVVRIINEKRESSDSRLARKMDILFHKEEPVLRTRKHAKCRSRGEKEKLALTRWRGKGKKKNKK